MKKEKIRTKCLKVAADLMQVMDAEKIVSIAAVFEKYVVGDETKNKKQKTFPTEKQIRKAANEWAFEKNGDKWSNNTD